MIGVVSALGERKDLTYSSALRWLSQAGFGGPFDLDMAQRVALDAFIASRGSTYGFLQREAFIAALEGFVLANPKYVRLRQHALKSILFLGAIDGRPELDFMQHFVWLGSAEITSYGAVPPVLAGLPDRLAPSMRARLRVRGDIDASDLQRDYPANSFDCVVWIGPTCDGNLPQTPALVSRFVASAPRVLRPGGCALVVQDFKTPNFRGILDLPGAMFCCSLQLEGRTQTQHSASLHVLEDRTDQMVAFVFDGGGAVVTDQSAEQSKNAFVLGLTHILRAPKNLFPETATYQKKELADLIFEYAKDL